MLIDQINQDVKKALIAKESSKVTLLRQLVSSIKNEEISLSKKEEGLSEDEVIAVLKREQKKRKDSIEQYSSAGRSDLADTEKEELEIIKSYLPEEMSEEAVKEEVKKIISDFGDIAPSDFGKVMGRVMSELKGKADGSLVNKIVKSELSS